MTKTMSESGKLIMEKDGPVTRITMNRPRVHNALDEELSQDLQRCIPCGECRSGLSRHGLIGRRRNLLRR